MPCGNKSIKNWPTKRSVPLFETAPRKCSVNCCPRRRKSIEQHPQHPRTNMVVVPWRMRPTRRTPTIPMRDIIQGPISFLPMVIIDYANNGWNQTLDVNQPMVRKKSGISTNKLWGYKLCSASKKTTETYTHKLHSTLHWQEKFLLIFIMQLLYISGK